MKISNPESLGAHRKVQIKTSISKDLLGRYTNPTDAYDLFKSSEDQILKSLAFRSMFYNKTNPIKITYSEDKDNIIITAEET